MHRRAYLAALVQVPILTYLRYYALLVLGDIEPEFDIVRIDDGA